MECTTCKIKAGAKDSKNPIFPCDSCRNYYCGECSELSSSEIRCMPLQKRLLKFHCKNCRGNELNDALRQIISDKETIIKDKNTIIDLLQQEINELKKVKVTASYAEITSNSGISLNQQRRPVNNIPSIIIAPIKTQDVQKTIKEIQNEINPQNINVSVNSMKPTKNGSVVIKCTTQEGAKKLVEETQKNKNLGTKYNVKVTQMNKPRIKIVCNSNMTNEEFEDCIKTQNSFLNNEDNIKVTYVKKSKSDKRIIFAECCGSTFSKLLEHKKVYIGWERCPIYEDLSISKCKICYAYDHKDSSCKNKVTCIYCGEGHKIEICPKRVKKCCNCIKSVEKYNLKYDVNHVAYDRDCPTLKYYEQRKKNNIDYS